MLVLQVSVKNLQLGETDTTEMAEVWLLGHCCICSLALLDGSWCWRHLDKAPGATSSHWHDLSKVKTSARLPEDGGDTVGWLTLVWVLRLEVLRLGRDDHPT